MHNPSYHLSGALSTESGAFYPNPQQLLEEIDGANTSPTSQKKPTYQGYPKSAGRSNSVWVSGGIMAEDARTKLRVADEARQRKTSIKNISERIIEDEALPPFRRRSTQTEIRSASFRTGIWKPPPPPTTFKEIGLSEPVPATAVDATSPIPGSQCRRISPKRLPHNLLYLMEPWSKRKRSGSLPEHGSGGQGDKRPNIQPMSATIKGSLLRSSTFTERTESMADPGSLDATRRYTLGPISSFRPVAEIPRGTLVPAMPMRNSTPMDGSAASPVWTPAWVRAFHVIYGEKPIYMNVHREDWKEGPVCVHCFRQHGKFHCVYSEDCGCVDKKRG